MRRKGFTLIELLVVIAIIAILAAILFPVFARAREKARQTACLSNVKQMALAVKMYTSDNDGVFPFCEIETNDPNLVNFYEEQTGKRVHPTRNLWPDEIMPYVNNSAVFVCPSRPDQWIGYSWSVSLGYVATPANLSKSSRIYHGVKESVLAFPAETAMLADSALYRGKEHHFYNHRMFYLYHANMSNYVDIHNELINIALADGHAKAYKLTQAWDICMEGMELGHLYWRIGRNKIVPHCGENPE